MINIKIIWKNKNNLLLTAILLLISFFTNYLAYNAYVMYYIDANTNFSYSSISFLVTTDSKGLSVIKKDILCPDEIKDTVSLYRTYSSGSTSMYGVICSEEQKNIISGTGFTKEDLSDPQKHFALIGADVEKICDTGNIKANGYSYQVKGIFKDTKKPSNNYTIYINESSDSIPFDEIFIIDGHKKSDIKKAFEKIRSSLTENGYTVNRIINDKVSPSNFVNYQLPIVVIYIFTFFIMIFLNSIISFFWLFSNQREIAILRLIGKKYSGKILIRYTICSTIANITGTFISFILCKDVQFFSAGILSVILIEATEIISLSFGMIYFNTKDTHSLMEIDYE